MGRKMQVAVFPGTSGTRRNKIIVRKLFPGMKPGPRVRPLLSRSFSAHLTSICRSWERSQW